MMEAEAVTVAAKETAMAVAAMDAVMAEEEETATAVVGREVMVVEAVPEQLAAVAGMALQQSAAAKSRQQPATRAAYSSMRRR